MGKFVCGSYWKNVKETKGKPMFTIPFKGKNKKNPDFGKKRAHGIAKQIYNVPRPYGKSQNDDEKFIQEKHNCVDVFTDKILW